MTDLHMRAKAAGLQSDWEDAGGRRQRVSDDALKAILDRLREVDPADDPLAFVSADIDRPIQLASDFSGPAELVLEDGSTRSVAIENGAVPSIDVAGYHVLRFGSRSVQIAVAPKRCYTIADAAPGRRLWGPAVQIPALRGIPATAFGDFGTLADTARRFAARGADALAISPTHALFPADADRFSPYAPSSRQFLNVLFADAPDEPQSPSPELIDWHGAIPARLSRFREAYRSNARAHEAELAAFKKAGGNDLANHALFDAIHAYFFAQTGARGWQDWPTAFHDPSSPSVRQFAAEHADDVSFYLYLQWRAQADLDRAQAAAIDAGMAIGLVADLAVGMDPGGSHGWSRRGDLLTGLSIGAPPDPLGPDGQSWGITGFDPLALRRTGFAPFIATIRAALAHAGGIRIDHAFGLRRLWVVPEGASAAEGAYLDMPFDDLMRIVAIESQRAKAIVIGEDLGTVPDGFRTTMQDRAMLGMRVLWFERDSEGGFVPPETWSPDAVAMTGTHDLATVAGWWKGRDIDWTWKLGRTTDAVDEAADRAGRAKDRHRLWDAFATGTQQPAIDDTDLVVDAAVAHIAGTPCALAILPMEDLVGLVEQPNLPGTIDEHPNWRRRMPDTTEALLAQPEVSVRIDTLTTMRTA